MTRFFSQQTLSIAFMLSLLGGAHSWAAEFSVGDECMTLGVTTMAKDRTTTIGCFKKLSTDPDCTEKTGSKCIYKRMTCEEDGELLRIAFEIVGAGGGGGGVDYGGGIAGGAGGSGAVLRFDAYLPKGKVLTVSPGVGGEHGESSVKGASALGVGGSGFLGNIGKGGKGGASGTSDGPSGTGGGGGASSIVQGEGFLAVAGGGGGGGGSGCYVGAGAGNPGVGGAIYADGKDGYRTSDCDGGGGGGGGAGYPGGSGGNGGCDSGPASVGGNQGVSAVHLAPGEVAAAFTGSNNIAAGIGAGGSSQHSGGCGRVTIWSSNGQNKTTFDCGSAPFWTVQ